LDNNKQISGYFIFLTKDEKIKSSTCLMLVVVQMALHHSMVGPEGLAYFCYPPNESSSAQKLKGSCSLNDPE
jgi:hypothetical protein